MLTAITIMKAPEAGRNRASRVTMRSQTARPNEMRTMPEIRDAILRAQGEYREMPGLSLTLAQAARLWGFDRSTCELVLANLVERRILKRALNGTYVRR